MKCFLTLSRECALFNEALESIAEFCVTEHMLPEEPEIRLTKRHWRYIFYLSSWSFHKRLLSEYLHANSMFLLSYYFDRLWDQYSHSRVLDKKLTKVDYCAVVRVQTHTTLYRQSLNNCPWAELPPFITITGISHHLGNPQFDNKSCLLYVANRSLAILEV